MGLVSVETHFGCGQGVSGLDFGGRVGHFGCWRASFAGFWGVGGGGNVGLGGFPIRSFLVARPCGKGFCVCLQGLVGGSLLGESLFQVEQVALDSGDFQI